MVKIQQHDGVVVDAGVTAAGLRRSTTRGRGVAGEREAPRLKGAAAPSPLYIGPLGGRRPRGGVPPKPGGAPPHPRVPNPRRMRWAMGGAPAHQGLVPFPLQPMGPSKVGGPTRWTPGTLPVVPIQYR